MSELSTLNLAAGRYFLEVARAHSIRQAADRLQVAPSAISRQITKLEHELNTRLVERRAGGVELTEAGIILIGHLEEIFDRVDRIAGEIADLNGLKGGSVTIATVEGITRPFLSDRIASFRKTHRAVCVDENKPFCAVSAQIAASIGLHCVDDLDAPVQRIGSLDAPAFYSPKLEELQLPYPDVIVAKVLGMF